MAMDMNSSYQVSYYKSPHRRPSRDSYAVPGYPVTVGRDDDPCGPSIFPMVHYDTTFSATDVTGSKGGAVAKLLEDDLDWTAKYLHSENLARTSSVVVPPIGVTQRGRDSEVKRVENGVSRHGTAVPMRPRSLSRVGLRSTERVSVPRSITSHPPQPRYARSSSVVYRPSYKTNSNSFSSSSSSSADDYNSVYQPVPSSAFVVAERSFSKDFSSGLQAPRKPDFLVPDYSANHQRLNGKPEMSDTRRKLRKLICETRNDPYLFD